MNLIYFSEERKAKSMNFLEEFLVGKGSLGDEMNNRAGGRGILSLDEGGTSCRQRNSLFCKLIPAPPRGSLNFAFEKKLSIPTMRPNPTGKALRFVE